MPFPPVGADGLPPPDGPASKPGDAVGAGGVTRDPPSATAPVAPAATRLAAAPPPEEPIAVVAGGMSRSNAGRARMARISNENPPTTPARSRLSPIMTNADAYTTAAASLYKLNERIQTHSSLNHSKPVPVIAAPAAMGNNPTKTAKTAPRISMIPT